MNERWRVEYSKKADRTNYYPWHIEPISRVHPDNDWANSWEVVFIGNSEEAFKKLHELVSAWEGKSPTKQHKAKEKGRMSPTIRYNILQRDEFRCVLCGRSSIDGAKLHVDHIIPLSKGGYTEYNNLRTLCAECNHGKGANVP